MNLLIPYLFVLCGLIGSLLLFVNLKREIRINSVKCEKKLQQMAAQVSEARERAPEPVFIAAPALRSGWNLNKRVQALRMIRRNEDISTISAALGVTRREVELLIRVQLGRHLVRDVE